jgi:hypothetical protein
MFTPVHGFVSHISPMLWLLRLLEGDDVFVLVHIKIIKDYTVIKKDD